MLVLLASSALLNALFIRNPDLAAAIALITFIATEWLAASNPLVLWTPEHEAKVGIRPSTILKALIGGVLGIAFGLAIVGVVDLQRYAVAAVIGGLIFGPIIFCLLPSWKAALSLGLVGVLCISGLIVMTKYREARFVNDTVEHLLRTIQ